MRGARAKLLAAAFGLGIASLVAACGSAPEKKGDPGSPAPSASPAGEGDERPTKTLAQRPFLTVFDALDRHYVGDGFEPGRETVAAAIHSGLHATLFYLATRGTIPTHLHKNHEESLFVLDGSGTLVLPGKRVHLEPGLMVRLEPGLCHGYVGDHHDPLKALIVMTPPVDESDPDFVAANADAPGTLATPWVMDVTSTDALPALPPQPDSVIAKRVLDSSKYSTLTVAAVRRDRLPDHIHRDHDETTVIFAQKGLGFMRIDEVVHIVETGSIMHIPAGSVHSFEHQAEGHVRAFTIHTPAYDGTDMIPVEQKDVAKPPPGYIRTDRTGDFRDTNDHAAGGIVGPESETRKRVVVGPGDR